MHRILTEIVFVKNNIGLLTQSTYLAYNIPAKVLNANTQPIPFLPSKRLPHQCDTNTDSPYRS